MHKGINCADHNCYSDSEISTLSRDISGLKPNNRLQLACDAITKHVDKRRVIDCPTRFLA